MGMVLEDSIEVMRGSIYEQLESEREDRGSKEMDGCPLTPPNESISIQTRVCAADEHFDLCDSGMLLGRCQVSDCIHKDGCPC
jgi:hypothetical protein